MKINLTSNKMKNKKIKNWNQFISVRFEDEYENIEGFTPNDLYNDAAQLVSRGATLLSGEEESYDNEGWNHYNNMDDKIVVELRKLNTEEAIEMMTALRKKEKQWSMNYEHDLLLIFWLAIDKGDTKVLNEMIDYDVSFKHIAILAFRRCWEMHEKWGTGTGDNKIGRK